MSFLQQIHNSKFNSFSELFGKRMAGPKRGEKGHADVRRIYTKHQDIPEDKKDVGFPFKMMKVRTSA